MNHHLAIPQNQKQILELQIQRLKQQNSVYLQKLQKHYQNQYEDKINEFINSYKNNNANNNESSVDEPIKHQTSTSENSVEDENITPDGIRYYYKLTTNASVNPSIPYGTFSGPQLKALYNIPTIIPSYQDTRKVIVAIIIAYHCPTLQSDLNTYWKSPFNFGPTSTPPSINVYTFQGATVNSGWNLEECLDVQMVATANPNANIWVVEARSSSQSDLNAAIQYATTKLNADIISMSWGGNDTTNLITSNSLFMNPIKSENYKCFCASSGDNNSVNWPSVLSNVISVGGSTLVWNPNSTTPLARSEYTWTNGGCGFSTSVAKPHYQNDVNPNATYRATPDVSLIANPTTGVSIVYNGQWNQVGGTSVACPFFAGILSLANQQRFNAGKNPLTTVYTQSPTTNNTPSSIPQTHLQTYLYESIYKNPDLKTKCLTDITTGTDGKYIAGSGYDIATGLGSPNATALCDILFSNIP